MAERKGVITFKGGPLTLVGPELKVGQAAPDVSLVGRDLSPVSLSTFKGKVNIISAVPSLDTPVCDLQTRTFHEKVKALGPGVVVTTVSMDLPFAQGRWCAAAGLAHVTTLSDYRGAPFGNAYGVFTKELYLLARSVFVVDKAGVVRYIQIVNEVTQEPDYAAALDAAKKCV